MTTEIDKPYWMPCRLESQYLLEQEELGIPEVLVEYIGPSGATVLVFAESHFTL